VIITGDHGEDFFQQAASGIAIAEYPSNHDARLLYIPGYSPADVTFITSERRHHADHRGRSGARGETDTPRQSLFAPVSFRYAVFPNLITRNASYGPWPPKIAWPFWKGLLDNVEITT